MITQESYSTFSHIIIKKSFLYFSLLALFFCSCNKKQKIEKEVLEIETNIKIERFDQLFSDLELTHLKTLQKDFSFLFPKKYKDDFWIKKSKDTLQQEIKNEIAKVFPNTDSLKNELELLYKHLKFYYPQIEEPRIITIISEVDYQSNIILTKELLLVSLDCYLHKEHYFYNDISRFIAEDFKPSLICVDVAEQYAKKIISRPDHRSFLSQMILHGKRIYLTQKLLPLKSLHEIFRYTEEELKWNQKNESLIWRYFIEKDILYSTNKKLLPRFLYPAPFSKFYKSYDNESPDRVGQYIGYRIVDSFMKNNDVSLQQLMNIDSNAIFKKSKFKPKK